MPVFRFPEEPAWNEAADAVELAVEVGEYLGRVFIARREWRGLLGHTPKPEEAVELAFINQTLIERAVEVRIRERRLDEDANVHLTGRDLARAGKSGGGDG